MNVELEVIVSFYKKWLNTKRLATVFLLWLFVFEVEKKWTSLRKMANCILNEKFQSAFLFPHAVLIASSQGLRLVNLSWMEIIENSRCPGLLTVTRAAKRFDLLKDRSVWSHKTLLIILPVCFGHQRMTLSQHFYLHEHKFAEVRYLGTCLTLDKSSWHWLTSKIYLMVLKYLY